jgi:hypothetical protein
VYCLPIWHKVMSSNPKNAEKINSIQRWLKKRKGVESKAGGVQFNVRSESHAILLLPVSAPGLLFWIFRAMKWS